MSWAYLSGSKLKNSEVMKPVVDDAFHAWTSGSLNQMIKASATKTNLINRHFLLLSIVQATYKLRKEEKYKKLCVQFSETHLEEFPNIIPVLRQQDKNGILPSVPTFQHFATILTENGEYNKAISVCEQALEYGLRDNTKSGFEGRIQRIKKKL